jgi:hypothetical protein
VPERVLATSDCERCRPGLVSQPANAVSSLAYVVAGAAMLRGAARTGPTETALAWATVAAGVGSVAYHGPGGAVGRYAHDAGLIAMLGFLALSDVERLTGERRPAGLAAVPLVAAVGAAPRLSPATQALAGLTAAIAEGARLRRTGRPGGTARERLVAAPALALGLAAQGFGRTGGPWCRPDSLLQPHALWHVLTAGALWARSAGAAR